MTSRVSMHPAGGQQPTRGMQFLIGAVLLWAAASSVAGATEGTADISAIYDFDRDRLSFEVEQAMDVQASNARGSVVTVPVEGLTLPVTWHEPGIENRAASLSLSNRPLEVQWTRHPAKAAPSMSLTLRGFELEVKGLEVDAPAAATRRGCDTTQSAFFAKSGRINSQPGGEAATCSHNLVKHNGQGTTDYVVKKALIETAVQRTGMVPGIYEGTVRLGHEAFAFGAGEGQIDALNARIRLEVKSTPKVSVQGKRHALQLIKSAHDPVRRGMLPVTLTASHDFTVTLACSEHSSDACVMKRKGSVQGGLPVHARLVLNGVDHAIKPGVENKRIVPVQHAFVNETASLVFDTDAVSEETLRAGRYSTIMKFTLDSVIE